MNHKKLEAFADEGGGRSLNTGQEKDMKMLVIDKTPDQLKLFFAFMYKGRC
jgi:hypothetical protein